MPIDVDEKKRQDLNVTVQDSRSPRELRIKI